MDKDDLISRSVQDAGSTPAGSTKCGRSSMVERDLAKVDTGVQFPSSAPRSIRITANISALQAEDVGSIPTWNSKKFDII